MTLATQEDLLRLDRFAENRKREILMAPDALTIQGAVYYVSNDGNDENDGLSPDRSWQTLDRVSNAELKPGDGVRFRRGDCFRGSVKAKAGVSYGAYGTGEKPRFYSWEKDLANPSLWCLHDEKHHIWKLTEQILDIGTLVFDQGKQHALKLIPSYKNGVFVCRDDETRRFEMQEEMTHDLDLYWHFDAILTTKPSRGEDFPIPNVSTAQSLGELYLRCDRGNPGEVFSSIEALARRNLFCVGSNANVRIDNLCLKYIGCHAISAGGASVKGLHVTNCEIGWIGGCIQHYSGTDPNYPEGGRGTVTRYGNGVEIYGGCEDYEVSNCYIYQVYDAGITHQVTTSGKPCVMKKILYRNNLVEDCVYSIEYFLEKPSDEEGSYMEDVEMCGNILRRAGYGWGQQRHNKHTPAHIKGWSYVNTASNFRICENLFDRSAYRMLHLVAECESSCPEMRGNTYIQQLGGTLGQYGANQQAEPACLPFDEHAEETIAEIFGDKNAKVYSIES